MSVLMRWTAPFQRHPNVSSRDKDGPAASVILAFAERQLLAKSRRQRVLPITTAITPKPDMQLPMSVFSLITSVVGGKAAVKRYRRLRPVLTHSGRGEGS